jgi:ferric-dicitrate binding protein FerR (iron transport regulator)
MEIDRNTLVRYFSGESSEKERACIHQWLESDGAHEEQFIRERIRFDASLVIDETKIPLTRRGSVRRLVWTALKVAASLFILVGSSYLFSLYRGSAEPEIRMQSIHVPAGNRTSLFLPDGSLVWLNSNTSIKYPGLFSGNERIVELDGEAWFEVAKDKGRPFLVKTSTYTIEALGTTFNVEAYAAKSAFVTALFTGKVRIYKDREEEPLYLNPGEAAQLTGHTLEVSSAQVNTYRWKEGLIIIEDKSFEEIMLLFEKYFDQQIIIKSKKVKDLGYRGKLRIADGVDHALRVLQNDFRFTYKREEDTNTIYIY